MRRKYKKCLVNLIPDFDFRYREIKSTHDWWRSPYLVSFKAGKFDFVMLAVHLRRNTTTFFINSSFYFLYEIIINF